MQCSCNHPGIAKPLEKGDEGPKAAIELFNSTTYPYSRLPTTGEQQRVFQPLPLRIHSVNQMLEQVQMEQVVVCLSVLPEGTWTRRPLWSGSSRELYRNMHFRYESEYQGHL